MEFQDDERLVNEDEGRFPVTLVRLGSPENTIQVMVHTMDGSAIAGQDYVAVHKLVTFNPGVTELKVRIEVIDDNAREPDEYFSVKLSVHDNMSSGGGQHNYRVGVKNEMTITIRKNDNEQCNPPCGPGMKCDHNNQICVPRCTRHDQCGNGKQCQDGICVPIGG